MEEVDEGVQEDEDDTKEAPAPQLAQAAEPPKL
jgi:hypothetical protein